MGMASSGRGVRRGWTVVAETTAGSTTSTWDAAAQLEPDGGSHCDEASATLARAAAEAATRTRACLASDRRVGVALNERKSLDRGSGHRGQLLKGFVAQPSTIAKQALTSQTC